MERLKHKKTCYSDEASFPGSLKDAHFISEAVGIPFERIMELADSFFIPHCRIDGGEPMFQLTEVKKWVAKNLLERVPGKEIPFTLRVMVDPPAAKDAPAQIREIDGLRQVLTSCYPPGVYFLVKEQEVVYIGQSINPLSRVGSHTDKDFDRAYMVPVPSSCLDAVEGALIRAMNPKLNSGSREVAVGPGDRSDDADALKKFAAGAKI